MIAPEHSPVRIGRSFLRSFPGRLALVTAAAFALRVWYTTTIALAHGVGGDPSKYHLQANDIADGRWFIDPFTFQMFGQQVDSSFHPPLWSLLLSVFSAFGARSVELHQLVGCLVGAATVIVVGLIGKRLGGPRTGLVAAGFAAVYPNLWITNGVLEPEALYGLLIALVVLGAYRWIEAPSPGRAAALGAVIALGMLTRSEASLLLPLVVVPLVVRAPGLDRVARWRQLGAAVIACLVVLAPYTIFNFVRFERPVFISTELGFVLDAANCDESYSGPDLGYQQPTLCASNPLVERLPGENEAEWTTRLGKRGVRYALDHIDEVPKVLAFRALRQWSVVRITKNIDVSIVLLGRDRTVSWIGEILYFVTLPLAIGGAFVLARRRRPLLPLLVLPVTVTITAMLAFADIRLRTSANIALVTLTGVCLAYLTEPGVPSALLRRVAARLRRSGPEVAARSTRG